MTCAKCATAKQQMENRCLRLTATKMVRIGEAEVKGEVSEQWKCPACFAIFWFPKPSRVHFEFQAA
jgi:hypothetical protein